MKKLASLLGIALVVMSCHSTTSSNEADSSKATADTSKNLSPVSQTDEELTLNGIPVKDYKINGIPQEGANSLVTRFINDHTSSDNKTAIWFSKKWVDEIVSMLETEHAYGFRVYFAQKPADEKNTVIIVSTDKDGKDYFAHNSEFLKSLRQPETRAQSIIENYYGNDSRTGDPGATLYNDSFNCVGITGCVLTGANNMNCDEAKKSVLNFRDQRTPHQGMGMNTNSELYPISLLNGLDQLLGRARTNHVEADGIRLYFARNPKNKNRHHFIFITTKTVGASHVDDYDCYGAKVNFGDWTKSGPTNNGEQCPNNCTGATLPK